MRQSATALIFLSPRKYRPDPAHEEYCRLRQAANRALLAWLRTRPDPDNAVEEVEGGASAQRQLLRLWLAGGVS
jgi:hypothetical protein